MKILALEPYYGGSHKAFIDGWSTRSRCDWTVLGLAAYKWKWRMRHSAITFAQDVAERVAAGEGWDVLFCSDMLNLAEFLGLAPACVQALPTVAYFHENQLTYPVRQESERDYQFAMTNLTTALAATEVWFNSGFGRDEFLAALDGFLKRMPDHQPTDAVAEIREKSSVHPPGIDDLPARGSRRPGPIRILWAGRWEHDKNPDTFFDAVRQLQSKGVDFRISVIGEQFRDSPAVFAWAKDFFAERIDRWGYQSTRDDYVSALAEADVIVSTADHEFFGITVVEAIAAGAYPVLPKRLAYPEILELDEHPEHGEFFYDGTGRGLANKLAALAEQQQVWQDGAERAVRVTRRFNWNRVAVGLDDALARL